MSKEYHHPKVPEVLEAYKLLLNDSMALDYCGISGKERKLILNDPEFVREARKIKAEKYYEEITDVNNLIKSLNSSNIDENARFSDGDDDPTKKITLRMKATAMRREMLSLTSDDKENDEADSLNIFFVDITKEEFEQMLNVEIHEGDENTRFISDDTKETPMEKANKIKAESKIKTSVPDELACNVIEYVDAEGNKVIEEVGV